jgi:hypothetical protein
VAHVHAACCSHPPASTSTRHASMPVALLYHNTKAPTTNQPAQYLRTGPLVVPCPAADPALVRIYLLAAASCVCARFHARCAPAPGHSSGWVTNGAMPKARLRLVTVYTTLQALRILMPLTGSKTTSPHQMAVKMELVNGNTTGVIPQFGLEVAHIHWVFRLSALGGQKMPLAD